MSHPSTLLWPKAGKILMHPTTTKHQKWPAFTQLIHNFAGSSPPCSGSLTRQFAKIYWNFSQHICILELFPFCFSPLQYSQILSVFHKTFAAHLSFQLAFMIIWVNCKLRPQTSESIRTVPLINNFPSICRKFNNSGNAAHSLDRSNLSARVRNYWEWKKNETEVMIMQALFQ